MAEENGNDGAPAAGSDEQAVAPPAINVLLQYTKDFSFENPGAPQSLIKADKTPKIDIGINVDATTLGNDNFEVELGLNAIGKVDADDGTEQTAVFAVELKYRGVFRVQNVPEDSLHAVVLIECPRLLFPFARQIIADATRDGGYPPLMVDPIDFAALYRQRLQKAAQEQMAAAEAEAGEQ